MILAVVFYLLFVFLMYKGIKFHYKIEDSKTKYVIIHEGEVDLKKLRSPAEVMANPPILFKNIDQELGYRESSYCHHCGCNCKNNKIISKDKKLTWGEKYWKKKKERDDDDPFGPPF